MNTRCDPRELVVQLLKRSGCAVQVAAVIVDKWGIHAWGWNSSGRDGMGQHAEAHAIMRANRQRLNGSTIYTAARRQRNGRAVTARPCSACQRLIKGLGVVWRDSHSEWQISL